MPEEAGWSCNRMPRPDSSETRRRCTLSFSGSGVETCTITARAPQPAARFASSTAGEVESADMPTTHRQAAGLFHHRGQHRVTLLRGEASRLSSTPSATSPTTPAFLYMCTRVRSDSVSTSRSGPANGVARMAQTPFSKRKVIHRLSPSCLRQRGDQAAVDDDALSRDVAGDRRAEEGDQRAELLGPAVAGGE